MLTEIEQSIDYSMNRYFLNLSYGIDSRFTPTFNTRSILYPIHVPFEIMMWDIFETRRQM